MYFYDRQQAGKLLAEKLEKYKGEAAVVYALPRGGIVTAGEIASAIKAPLDLVVTRKIGHPHNSEYAIAAVSEDCLIGNEDELKSVDKEWFDEEKLVQLDEISRRKNVYLKGRNAISPKGKVAILVDDGVATGLTLRVGIAQLRHLGANKIIVAVPVLPQPVAEQILIEADELVALSIPSEEEFLGAVGSYYEVFGQVDDTTVIDVLKKNLA